MRYSLPNLFARVRHARPRATDIRSPWFQGICHLICAVLCLLALQGFTTAHGQATSITTTQPLVSFEADRISARETDGALSLRIRSNQPLIDTLIFGVEVIPIGGADPDQLISLQGQGELNPNTRSTTLNFVIVDNADLTQDQSYTVRLYPLSLGTNQGLLTEGTAQIRLIDDEAFAPARLIDLKVAEDAEQALIELRLDRAAEVSASATLEVFADTAQAGADFVAQSGVVFINPGDQSAVFPLQILDDEVFEADERLFVRLVDTDALEIVDFDAEIQIVDNDTPPQLVFLPERDENFE